MGTLIQGATLIRPGGIVEDGDVLVEQGHIAAVGRDLRHNRALAEPVQQVVEAAGRWLAPGYIDLHIHGAVGCDTMDASAEALHTMAQFLAGRGITSFLPTTMSAPLGAIEDVLQQATVHPRPDGAQHLGLHLEGPYLSPQRAGAQPTEYFRYPDPDHYLPWFQSDVVRLVTVAPELPGAREMIAAGRASGVAFAVGHSEASYEQTVAAIEAGATQATHIFNAMSGLHHRSPGILGAVLVDDRLDAQVIADGIHLHPRIVDLVVRLKGAERTLLITDAMQATGLPDGEYRLGAQPVVVRDGVARTPKGDLASSTLTLDQAVRNIVRFSPASLPQTVQMASETPARALDIFPQKGAVLPDSDADLLLLDSEYNVVWVMVRGRVVLDQLS
ncbi:MAG: N-acetylglucosamine-6-phosphate deacetylase [Chloroflexota bacterium]